MNEVWIWQRYTSPHTAALARELAERVTRVCYVVEHRVHEGRAALGWQMPELGKAEFIVCEEKDHVRRLAREVSPGTEHIFQGVRGNGFLGLAQAILAQRGLSYWAFFETVENRGVRGVLRRMVYRVVLWRQRSSIRGLLAIGYGTPAWLEQVGFPAGSVYPFTYFLGQPEIGSRAGGERGVACELLFVGNLIPRKGVDILLRAMSEVPDIEPQLHLTIVGNGPEEAGLRSLARVLKLEDRVAFVGNRTIDKVASLMRAHDLLVLPSRFDGWGVVVVEALMQGTPALVSEACGAAEAVRASGVGAVFRTGDPAALAAAIAEAVASGSLSTADRQRVADWAMSFNASAGADYFLGLCEAAERSIAPPPPPWRRHCPAFAQPDVEKTR